MFRGASARFMVEMKLRVVNEMQCHIRLIPQIAPFYCLRSGSVRHKRFLDFDSGLCFLALGFFPFFPFCRHNRFGFPSLRTQGLEHN